MDGLELLLRRCSAGDRAALDEIYDLTAAQVNGLALRVLGDLEAAEEVTFDVYFELWRRADRFDPSRGSGLGYLLTLTRSRAIDRLRQLGPERHRSEPLEAIDPLPDQGPDPEELWAITEERRRVQVALEDLGADQRRAIELAYFRGFSHSEIAREIDQPLGTVKTRIRLGMARLRDALSPGSRGAG